MKLASWAPQVHPRRRRTSCQRLAKVVTKHSLSKSYTAELRVIAFVSGAEGVVRRRGSLGLVPVARVGTRILWWWATDTLNTSPTHTSALFTFWLAPNARAYTATRSIGFSAIWVLMSSSSSLDAARQHNSKARCKSLSHSLLAVLCAASRRS